jgi:hypothetical protein
MRRAAAQNIAPPVLAAGKEFLKLIRKTAEKYAGKTRVDKESASRGPGVLEHRMAPRLEWLTDLGALSKSGLPRNSFEYNVTSDADLLFSLFDGNSEGPYWAEELAVKYWAKSSHWRHFRSEVLRDELGLDVHSALRVGYQLMKRAVGPVPIREVCFIASLLKYDETLSVDAAAEALIEWAKGEAAITLSGGRYRRTPELVHMAPGILAEGS